MRRSIRDSVIVITGASSGIGRSTARAAAARGAAVVICGRREEALRGVASECEALGGKAVAVPADVSDEAAVEHLAQRAIEEFGRIDAWVNNAAVTLFGRFDGSPSDVYRRVLDVNLFGYIHGMRAALKRFREQGSGVLVNVSSVVSTTPQPYTSAYGASKAAIRSITDSIRMELILENNHDIHVCTVMPATIDTPFFQQAANYTGRAPKAMKPVYPAYQVSEAVLELIKHPKREVYVGNAGSLLSLQRTIAPALHEKMFARQVDLDHLQDKPADPTPGNVFEPMPEYTDISGGWQANGASSTGKYALAALAVAVPAVIAYSRRS